MNYKKDDYVVFVDSVGHTVMSKFVEMKDDFITIKNPLIVSPTEKPNSGMTVQFFPLFFREFQASKNDCTVWDIPKNMVMWMNNLDLDIRLTSQYERIFAPVTNVMPNIQQNMQPIPQQKQPEPQVIKLFDE